jgi:hypothetical protein
MSWKFHFVWMVAAALVAASLVQLQGHINRRFEILERIEINQAAIEAKVASNEATGRLTLDILTDPGFCMCPTAEAISKKVWNSPISFGHVAAPSVPKPPNGRR